MAYYVGMWTFGRSIQVDERTVILTLRSWAESMKKKTLISFRHHVDRATMGASSRMIGLLKY